MHREQMWGAGVSQVQFTPVGQLLQLLLSRAGKSDSQAFKIKKT